MIFFQGWFVIDYIYLENWNYYSNIYIVVYKESKLIVDYI